MILEIRTENLTKDDLIVWDGKKWVNCKKPYFLAELDNKYKIIQEELKNAKIELKQAQKTIMELASIMKGE